MPTWDIYHYRGRVRLAQGRLREALADLRVAVRLARAWRWSAPAEDTARMGAEGWLAQVHAALIEAGNRLYMETRDPALLRETFEAAEENRSSSLRALLDRGQAQETEFAPEYWEALGQLQRAEVEALSGVAGAEDRLNRARAELIRMESASGDADLPRSDGMLERAQAGLDSGSALLGFHLGSADSWLWALDRGGLTLYRLPSREEIEPAIQAFRHAVQEDAPEAADRGARLHRILFGQLAPRFRQKTRWLLSLDDALFEVPFAALPEPGRPAGYAVESREITLVPGARYWLDSPRWKDAPESSSFLGIGDPIYNAADPRLGTRQGRAAAWLTPRLFASAEAGSALVLPRLVASGAELEACARAWNGDRMLLTGAAACRRNIMEQLRRDPAVVHFATHMLPGPGKAPDALIALSLTGGGEVELISPDDILRWRTHAGLVALSGCRSGEAAVLPGTGLVGLTRAWLAAGAHAVAGSRWETPDDEGGLFDALYRNLRRGTAGGALRLAQLEMIRSGGRRARPRYWGAYFVIGAE
jgi:CHAT domain-containing protein